LREFLRLAERETVPDHSWLSRTRSRLSLELHEQVFTWVLHRLSEHCLIKGERIAVEASTMEANAALRSIVRRDSGAGYREMLTRMAKESGSDTLSVQYLVLWWHQSGAKQVNPGSAVHCPLQRLEPVDLAFGLSIAPGFQHGIPHGLDVVP
jgi:hypothetical protein